MYFVHRNVALIHWCRSSCGFNRKIVICVRSKLLESEGKYHHEDSLLADRYEDFPESPSAYYHQSSRGGGDYWRRVHYEPGDSRAMRIETDYASNTRKYHSHQHRAPPAEYYEKKKKSHPVREVIMQRTEKPWRDERYVNLVYSLIFVTWRIFRCVLVKIIVHSASCFTARIHNLSQK